MRNFFSILSNRKKEFAKNTQIPESPEVNTDKLIDDLLIESEMRYRRLFETAKDGILILDFETENIIDANPFIIKLIDYPLKEIIGKKLWEIGMFSNMEQSEQAVIELKKYGYIRFEDMPIQRPSGKITEVEFISNVYLVNDKKVIQCNIRDITERKIAEKALKENEQNLKEQNAEIFKLNTELTESLSSIKIINEELITAKYKAEESDILKSAFLANMSHEIRTPLNAIMGFTNLLLEPELSREKMEEFIQIIHASSLQLMSVISDLIDISKIEAGQMSIDSEFVNVNNLMNELFVTYKEVVDPKKLLLNYLPENPDVLIQIKSDGSKIKQVLSKLLNNAIKFTSNGKIEFGYRSSKDFIEFYVNDTGIGITPENQKLIFQRFRQVETTSAREYGGNGLGLSISKALVEKMGGKITVESEFGAGSNFAFTIPFIKIKDTIVHAELKDKSIRFKTREEKTILIVENEKNNHAYIEELLKSKNIKTLHAWNGKEAVEIVKNHTDISLVLMDIKMPIMNGYEATQLIKQIRPKLPVIAQTALDFSNNKQQALAAGCDNYLAKPINKDYFMEVINSYLM